MRKLAVNVAEAARMLGCSKYRVYRAVETGDLPVLPYAIAGRRVLIPLGPLEALVADRAEFRSPAPAAPQAVERGDSRPAVSTTPAAAAAPGATSPQKQTPARGTTRTGVKHN